MLGKIVAFIFKSNGTKAGTAAISGTGIIALVFGLHQDIKSEVAQVKSERKEYVALVLEPVKTEITNLKEETKKTNQLLRDIHNHLLNRKEK